MERTAIFPGSFDPFTRGHAALVDEALNLFDRVIIGIGNNTSKQGLLTVENRKRLIDDIYRGNERVEATINTGLTGEYAEAAGTSALRVCGFFMYGYKLRSGSVSRCQRPLPPPATLACLTLP